MATMLHCSLRSELPGLVALSGLLAGCEHPGLGIRAANQTGGTPGVYDAPDGTCSATCSTPPGPILLYEDFAQSDALLRAGLVGVWQICNGAYSVFHDVPSDTIGVEFAPPPDADASFPEGNLFFLTRGPAGPVRGVGFEYQQTYVVSEGVLYCHMSYNAGDGWEIKYSPCPREWQIEYSYSGPIRQATLVPF
jgi:hypothetical protein